MFSFDPLPMQTKIRKKQALLQDRFFDLVLCRHLCSLDSNESTCSKEVVSIGSEYNLGCEPTQDAIVVNEGLVRDLFLNI